MKANNIIELSKYIVKKYTISSPIKLQKILFLIRFEEKKNNIKSIIFVENFNFEAWINGPVNPESYFYFRPYFYNDDELETFLPKKENEEKFKIYDKYIEKYNLLDPWELVNITHANLSWINARKGLNDDEVSNNKMNEKFIKEWRKEKLERADERLIMN